MANAPRVPCVQETARQERYTVEGFNVTGTPQTVVDDICGGQAPPDTGTPGNIGNVGIAGAAECSVGYSGTYYVLPESGAADSTYLWSLNPCWY